MHIFIPLFVSLCVGVLGTVVSCGNVTVTVVMEIYSGSPLLAGSVI